MLKKTLLAAGLKRRAQWFELETVLRKKQKAGETGEDSFTPVELELLLRLFYSGLGESNTS